MTDSLLARLAEIAETEFADVVITSEIKMKKLVKVHCQKRPMTH